MALNRHNGLVPGLDDFDPRPVSRSLSGKRPVFHSEADFQFAFAWECRLVYGEQVDVRLETHPKPHVRLDLELREGDTGVAIELKYLTRRWGPSLVNGERFALAQHGAQILRRYDVVADIARVEEFITLPGREKWKGYQVTLTNESAFWNPTTTRRTWDAEFRIGEGDTLAGMRSWPPDATPGTVKGREKAILLRRGYAIRWEEYSRLDDTAAGRVRALVIDITR